MSGPVDFTRIQETSDGDMEFEVELIEMYLEDAGDHAQTLLGILDSTNHEEIKQVAHTLKGSSANIGATLVQEVTAVIEKSASLGDMGDTESHSRKLKNAIAETETAFRAYIKEHS